MKRLNYSTNGCGIARFSSAPFASWTDEYLTQAPATTLVDSFPDHVQNAIINKWHPIHTSQYIWIKSVLGKFILRYVGDNVDMVHHIETRPPFLDHIVAEYANKIPPSLKMKYEKDSGAFLEKHVLRQAMKPFVTEEIYNRRKHPFLGPSRFTVNGPMHKVFQRLLTEENVRQVGFLDWDAVRSALDQSFNEGNVFAFRNSLTAAQFVVLSKRFNVKRAELPIDTKA
jgi:asparagine synthase (glutamine-hydrolysing)